MVVQNITPELQIRHLPFKVLRELGSILDIPGPRDWKALIAEIPCEDGYSKAEIYKFEKEGLRPGGSPAYEVLVDLGTQLTTVGQLVSYLKAIGNQEALLLLKPHEPVIITRHPISDTVPEHQEYVLKCEASGFPKPRYEWFKNGSPIPDARVQVLRLNNVSVGDSGEYMCKVTNPMGSVYSHPATLQVSPSQVMIVDGETSIQDPSEFLLRSNDVVEQTVPMAVGQKFVLNCGTYDGISYQWQKNGYPLPDACQPQLIFQSFTPTDEGRYSCKVTVNSGHVILTQIAHLKLIDFGPTNKGGFANNIPHPPTEFASGKMALVIANQNYQSPRNHNEQLVHPFDDAGLLQDTLEEIGFKVIRLFDLTKREIEKAVDGFCNILQCAQDLYSLFYFCGHGFEECGKTYLVPVDADTQWTVDRAISAEYILSKIQHCKRTKLDVMILDVCRIRLGNENLMESLDSYSPPFMPGAQCVFGYATCPQSMAFEKRGDQNGIYMKHLAAHLKQDIQIEHLFHQVGVAVSEECKNHRLTSKMSPTFKTTTTKKFSLADPIVDIPEAEKDPTQEWFSIHRLPASKSVQFDDGIVVDIKFIPVCSNVCIVLISVSNFGKAKWCDAQIIELCEEMEVPMESMNLEYDSLSEFSMKCVSYDFRQSMDQSIENVDKWTKVFSLQKLTGPFVLTIEVQYHKGDPQKTLAQSSKQVFRNDEFGIVQFFAS